MSGHLAAWPWSRRSAGRRKKSVHCHPGLSGAPDRFAEFPDSPVGPGEAVSGTWRNSIDRPERCPTVGMPTPQSCSGGRTNGPGRVLSAKVAVQERKGFPFHHVKVVADRGCVARTCSTCGRSGRYPGKPCRDSGAEPPHDTRHAPDRSDRARTVGGAIVSNNGVTNG